MKPSVRKYLHEQCDLIIGMSLALAFGLFMYHMPTIFFWLAEHLRGK